MSGRFRAMALAAVPVSGCAVPCPLYADGMCSSKNRLVRYSSGLSPALHGHLWPSIGKRRVMVDPISHESIVSLDPKKACRPVAENWKMPVALDTRPWLGQRLFHRSSGSSRRSWDEYTLASFSALGAPNSKDSEWDDECEGKARSRAGKFNYYRTPSLDPFASRSLGSRILGPSLSCPRAPA